MLLFLLNSLFYVPSVSISIMLNGSRYGSYLRGLLCDLKQGDGEGISTYTSNDNPRTDDNSTHPSWLHLLEQGKDPLLTEGKANEPNPPTSIKSLTVLQDTQEEGKNPLFGLLSTVRMELRFYTEKATEVSLHSRSPAHWLLCSYWSQSAQREPRHTDCCALGHQPLHLLAQKKPHTTLADFIMQVWRPQHRLLDKPCPESSQNNHRERHIHIQLYKQSIEAQARHGGLRL